jgi:hypothetical protein
MFMATVKELQTRIALKYDSFENWQKSDLVLLPGEVAICEIGGGVQELKDASGKVIERVQTAPTVLFKVGSADKKAFKDLPWASAKAADVYDWAKKPEAEFLSWLSATAAFATDAEVEALLQPISAAIADIEDSLNGKADGGIGKAVDALGERLDIIEGADTVEGSVAKALKDAKKYTDDREVEIKKYADQAELDAVATAKDYTDLKTAAGTQASADLADHLDATNPHGITAATVGLGKVENKTVAEIQTELTGAVADGDGKFVTGDAVYDAIEAAKTAAANTAQSKVDALADGQVKTNKEAIEQNASDIADNADAIEANTTAIETLIGSVAGDDDKSVREIAAEETAKIVAGADTKYDTLKEIADFILGDETGAAKMANDIAANAEAIEDIQDYIADDGALDVRISAIEGDLADAEDAISDNADAIEVLQKLTSGYTGEKGIYNRIEAVSERAEKGITDADNAAKAAKAAQDDVDALEIIVSGKDGNGGVVKQSADSAALLADITGTNGRIPVAEGKITALEGIVSTGDDANSKLRSAITTLQTLTGHSAHGNEALYGELTRVAGIVDNTTNGVAATYAIADKNKTDIGTLNGKVAAIEGDYLKATDFVNDSYIFNCGSSTVNTHVVAQA